MTGDLKISLTERDKVLEALRNALETPGLIKGRGNMAEAIALLQSLQPAAQVAAPEAPSGGVIWTQADEDRLDEAIAKRAERRAAAPEAGIVHPVPVSGEGATAPPAIGDYVLATKYHDGDPGDNWALGFYDGVLDTQGRHYVKDSAGRQIRGNGFRRVARVRPDVGRWMLEVAAKQLEACPPGTVNLWTMLTPAAFAVDASPSAAAKTGQHDLNPTPPVLPIEAGQQEPVAWELRHAGPDGAWSEWWRCRKADYEAIQKKATSWGLTYESRPLYTHPPAQEAAEPSEAAIVRLACKWYETGVGKDHVAHELALAVKRHKQDAAIQAPAQKDAP